MKALGTIIFSIILSFLSNSQSSKYSSSSSIKTWSANATPTVIHSAGVDDALSSAINIGFNFSYNSSSYNQFKASSNGFITFNTSNTLAQPTNNLATSTERTLLAVLWDDNRVGSSGNVNYKLSGSSPSRILTVEWLALRWNKSGFSAGTIDCQIKLYESSNNIEFIYNRGTYQSFGNSIGIGASIGINGSSSGDFLSLNDLGSSATFSKTAETTTIGVSPTNLTTMTQSGANAQISNGLTFLLSPPPVSLPISLLYFNVSNEVSHNHITWSTLSEHNNDYFNIEKTKDGVYYFNISTIKGAGNSEVQSYYEYDDYDISSDINYYRLKQTDYDGKIIYSALISVDNRNNKIKIVVKVVNLYGTEVDIKTPGVLLLIYDDGSIKKIING